MLNKWFYNSTMEGVGGTMGGSTYDMGELKKRENHDNNNF